MKYPAKISEVDLAQDVIAWLQDQHWDVYQEVQIYHSSKRADIVAVQNNVVWVIETKTSLSLDLLDQGYAWQYYANYVSVCYPHRHAAGNFQYQWAVKPIVYHILRDTGLGLLRAGRGERVSVDIPARMNRKANKAQLLETLCEQHKTFAAAGSNSGRFWSPFQDTCTQVRDYVLKNPGATLKDTLEKIKHHYQNDQSARGSLSHWLRAGKVRGVTSRVEGGKLKLFATDLT